MSEIEKDSVMFSMFGVGSSLDTQEANTYADSKPFGKKEKQKTNESSSFILRRLVRRIKVLLHQQTNR